MSTPAAITHPEKVLFPDDGITKGELASYYAAVAPALLPHVRGRPVTLERYPSGIGAKGFWQKNLRKGSPDWVASVELPKKDGSVRHPLIGDERSLQWAANQNAVTLHVANARVPRLRPDLCVFDLDPSLDEPERLRDAALAVRDLLDELGLSSWVKTSGSKGFHVVVPLDGSSTAAEVARFADAVGTLLVDRQPQRFTQEFYKADRAGRILIDTGRNGFGATFAAAYSVRALRGAPVSAPCSWPELERGDVAPQSFSLRTMPRRLADAGDPWSALHDRGGSLRPALERFAATSSHRPRSVK